MKDETSPVSPDEIVVRLVWHHFYKPGPPASVSDRAFLPKPDETDGISVFRAACLSDPTDVLTVIAPDKRDKYALALLPVAEILALGLSVQPAKIDALPGHAVITELNIDTFKSDKAKCQGLQRQLAAIATKNLIPPAPPPKT
jgi:hypothetical protein